MAMRITRWSPDTCACVVDIQWDDSVAQELRSHGAAAIVNQCTAHSGMALGAHYAKLMDENPRKNLVIDAMLTQVNGLTHQDMSWSYDASRVLNITCSKINGAQKTALQTLVDNKFGSGKVRLL